MKKNITLSLLMLLTATVISFANIPKEFQGFRMNGSLWLTPKNAVKMDDPSNDNITLKIKIEARGKGIHRNLPFYKDTHWRAIFRGKKLYGPMRINKIDEDFEIIFYKLEKKYSKKKFKKAKDDQQWFKILVKKAFLTTKLNSDEYVVDSQDKYLKITMLGDAPEEFKDHKFWKLFFDGV